MAVPRLLLTGIGGSAGCHMFRHIMAETNWHVVGIDSFRHKGLFDRVRVMLDAHPQDRDRLTLITHDLTAPFSDHTQEEIEQVDYIVNMASLSDVHASLNDPRRFLEQNMAQMVTMLEHARWSCRQAFVQFSTDEVYGPTDGTFAHPEWSSIAPSNPYSASKAAQEAAAICYWRAYGVPLIIVNSMNMFGEMQSTSKFPAIVQRRIRAGEEITIHGRPGEVGSRWYIHSRNSAHAVLHILRTVTPPLHIDGEVDRPKRFNIVGDKQVSNEELVLFIGKCIGKIPRYRFEDAKVSRPGHDLHYGLDGYKLKTELGWRSPLSFEASMRNTVAWYEDHPEWLG